MTYKKAESRRIVIAIAVIFVYCVMVFFLFRTFAYNQSYLGGYKCVKQNYNAIEVIFGCSRDKRQATSGNVTTGALKALGFSFWNLLPHLLICATLLLLILKLFISKLFNKIVEIICAAFMYLAGLLLFFSHKFANFMGNSTQYKHIAVADTFHLGWAAILFGIVTLICAILLTVSAVFAFKQDHLVNDEEIEEENERKETQFRSKSMAELKAELMKELGKSEDVDITKDAEVTTYSEDDLSIDTLNESKTDSLDIKLEDKDISEIEETNE